MIGESRFDTFTQDGNEMDFWYIGSPQIERRRDARKEEIGREKIQGQEERKENAQGGQTFWQEARRQEEALEKNWAGVDSNH